MNAHKKPTWNSGIFGACPIARPQKVDVCVLKHMMILCLTAVEFGWRMPMVFTWSNLSGAYIVDKLIQKNLP